MSYVVGLVIRFVCCRLSLVAALRQLLLLRLYVSHGLCHALSHLRGRGRPEDSFSSPKRVKRQEGRASDWMTCFLLSF